MEVIIFHPEELWAYFEEHREELRDEPKVVARNDALGIQICISADIAKSGLMIAVSEDEESIDDTTAFNGIDCCLKARAFYDKYLSVDYSTITFLDEMAKHDREDEEIEDREGELRDAADDFLWSILGQTGLEAMDDENVEEFIDDVCELLYKKYGFDIYRPMRLEDEDGKEFYEEYPYDHMEFEDE